MEGGEYSIRFTLNLLNKKEGRMVLAFHKLEKNVQERHLTTVKETVVKNPKSFSDFSLSDDQLNMLAYAYCNNALYNSSNNMINSLMIQVEESSIIN